jgi:hypothetical protein
MTAKHINSYTSTRHNFKVTHGEFTYDVVIWCNSKGKFIDDEISLNGEEQEHEGEQGDIREAITDYLAAEWDNLVKE